MKLYNRKQYKKAIKAIHELRELAGGTDQDLAQILKISAANVWLWRKGRQKVPVKHLQRIKVLFKKHGFDVERLRPDLFL